MNYVKCNHANEKGCVHTCIGRLHHVEEKREKCRDLHYCMHVGKDVKCIPVEEIYKKEKKL